MVAKIDRTGQRFGRLVVMRRSEVKRGYWVVKCDCGTVKETAACSMTTGEAKSCGCLSREDGDRRVRAAVEKYQYLIGQRFGSLLVKQIIGRPTRAVCLCDCGSVILPDVSTFLRDEHQSCGCKTAEINIRKKGEQAESRQIGRRYGRLVIQGRSETSRRHWICVCDCGAICDVHCSPLYRGSTQSCGCLIRAILDERIQHSTSKYRLMIGERHGRLLITGYIEGSPPRFRCVCDCGKATKPDVYNLIEGKAQSCGCLRREMKTSFKHGATTNDSYMRRAYFIWAGMKRRCYSPGAIGFRYYGGRGIEVCDRWVNSFEAFFEDMGPPPSADHSIDRINANGNYCPENCRWATILEQARNKRSNRLIEYQGESLCMSEWVERTGLTRSTISARLEMGWSIEKTLTTPSRKMRKNRTG